MGMDLEPINPATDAPRFTNEVGNYYTDYAPLVGKAISGRYNWTGWSYIINLLNKWGINTNEFSGLNDGDVICDETCKKVADAIEKHLSDLDAKDRKWLEPHIILWRTCGGYRQW